MPRLSLADRLKIATAPVVAPINLPAPVLAVSIAPSTLTIPAGQSGTVTLTLTPKGSFALADAKSLCNDIVVGSDGTAYVFVDRAKQPPRFSMFINR